MVTSQTLMTAGRVPVNQRPLAPEPWPAGSESFFLNDIGPDAEYVIIISRHPKYVPRYNFQSQCHSLQINNLKGVFSNVDDH